MAGTEQISKLWQMYEHGRAYQTAMGLTTQVPMNVDFYEGRQWAAKTESTKHIPRPIVNITKFIVRNKKSSIVGTPVSVVFSSARRGELAQHLTEFNRTIEAEMEMDEIRNRKAQDGIVKGTGIVHFYWDAEALGEVGDFEGGVRAENIEPLNIFFANPQERDEQKQKWILIASRVEVAAAKAMIDKAYKANVELVQADDQETFYSEEKEQDGEKLVTVLTRYFKKDGEVYFERGVKSTMLHEPRALTPKTLNEDEIDADTEQIEKVESDNGEDKLQDTAKEVERKGKKFRLYPISVYNYEPREKSIYGIGEVEGIIPNQKALNFNLAMQLLAIQNLAWGKWIVKKGALGSQKINNAPGQVLTDYTPNGVKGIYRSDEPAISNAPMSFSDAIVSMTRVVTGSTEVMTGEQAGANQSGAAIASLQAQALKPIQELRDRYLRSCRREAKILKQFYELFYNGKQYETTRSIDGQDSVEDATFNGVEYQDATFDITVDAGAGTPYSESLMVQLLSEFLQGGYIDFATYLELLPDQIAVFKASLMKEIKEGNIAKMQQLQSELKNAQEQSASMQTYLEQMAKALQAQGKSVDSVKRLINENRQLNATLAALYEESVTKINQANKIIETQAAANKEMLSDAETMAMMLAAETPMLETETPTGEEV